MAIFVIDSGTKVNVDELDRLPVRTIRCIEINSTRVSVVILIYCTINIIWNHWKLLEKEIS